MARGWESKSVESQIESADLKRAKPQPVLKSPDALRRERERESAELTRTRVLRDLAAATHPRHREQMQAALKHIEAQIAALTDPKDTH